MKKFLIAALACMSVLGMYAVAGTFTNGLGQVITVQTLEDSATAAKVTTDYQDYSTYADAAGKSGKIVRWYDFAVQGGATNTALYLEPKLVVPAGAVIRDGYIRVVTGVSPTVHTNSLSLASATANDIKGSGTNTMMNASTFIAVTPVGNVATAIKIVTNSYLTVRFLHGAVTNGKFYVVLDYDQM